MDRFELVSALINRTRIKIGQIEGIISSIQHEDGSGYNFNVTIRGWKLKYPDSLVKDNVTETLFVRCRQ